MSIADDIIDLNNNAIHLLHCGELNKAMLQFRLALENIKIKAVENNNVTTPSLPTERMKNGRTTFCSSFQKQKSHNTNSSFHDTFFTFFARAFICALPTEENQSKILVVVLYNMGLTHHLKSFKRNCCYKNLMKALTFYQMAMKIFMDVKENGIEELTGDTDMNLLLMAVLNNMGSIYCRLFDVALINQCLCFLRDVVGELLESSAIKSNDEDFRFFLEHVLVMSEQKLTVAPMA